MSETDVQAGFLTSAEYKQLHADLTAFVSSVYTDTLGRAADPAGLEFWTHVAESTAGPAAVALGILESPEADSHDITVDYAEFLSRLPDPAGLSSWLNLLVLHLLTPEQVELGIISSDEFFSQGG